MFLFCLCLLIFLMYGCQEKGDTGGARQLKMALTGKDGNSLNCSRYCLSTIEVEVREMEGGQTLFKKAVNCKTKGVLVDKLEGGQEVEVIVNGYDSDGNKLHGGQSQPIEIWNGITREVNIKMIPLGKYPRILEVTPAFINPTVVETVVVKGKNLGQGAGSQRHLYFGEEEISGDISLWTEERIEIPSDTFAEKGSNTLKVKVCNIDNQENNIYLKVLNLDQNISVFKHPAHSLWKKECGAFAVTGLDFLANGDLLALFACQDKKSGVLFSLWYDEKEERYLPVREDIEMEILPIDSAILSKVNYLLVAGTGEKPYLLTIDLDEMSIINRFVLPARPLSLAVNDDGSLAALGMKDFAELYYFQVDDLKEGNFTPQKIDMKTPMQISSLQFVKQQDQVLYALNSLVGSQQQLLEISFANSQATIKTNYDLDKMAGCKSPHSLTVSANQTVYITCSITEKIITFNLQNQHSGAIVSIPLVDGFSGYDLEFPQRLALSADQLLLFAVARDSPTFSIINAVQRSLISVVKLPHKPDEEVLEDLLNDIDIWQDSQDPLKARAVLSGPLNGTFSYTNIFNRKK